MKRTLAQVRTDYAVLMEISDKKLPVKMAYAIGRNIDKLSIESERAEKERIKLCESYADKDADGKPVMTKSVIDGQEVSGYQITDQGGFAAQLSELYATEIDIDLMQFPMDLLDQLDNDRFDPLTPAQIHDIGWMIKEDETC